jgi:outer membrane protein TolC
MRLPFLTAFVSCLCVCAGMRVAHADTLSLGRALELGKQTSALMGASRARVEGADARVTVARAAYVPSLTGSASGSTGLGLGATRTKDGGLFTYGYTSYGASGTARLRWTLWDFARGPSNIAADASLKGAEASLVASEADVLSDVATAYMNLVFRHELQQLIAETVSKREKSATITKALVKAGVQPQVEEFRSASRVESAKRDLANAASDTNVARVQLALLIGKDPSEQVVVTAPTFTNTLHAKTESAMNEAEVQHPSVQVAASNLRAQEANASQAFARYLPVLSLTVDGKFSYSYASPGNLVIPDRELLGQLVVSIPIFDLGTIGNARAAKADAQAAAASLRERKRTVRSDAAEAAESLISAEAVVDHARKASDTAEIVLTVIQARYAQGLTSALDLITVESDDLAAKSEMLRADFSRSLAAFKLLVATGNAKKLEALK